MCGTYRVSKLRSPDRIDKFHSGFLNLVERIAGKGRLFHCRWCRLQFYDRRPLVGELAKAAQAPEAAETPEAMEGAAGQAD
jgi:hypothetical protein